MDENLSFLSGYVNEALSNGARPYEKPEDDDDDDDLYDGGAPATSSGFKMTPYEKPQTAASMAGMRGMGSHSSAPSIPGVSLPPGAAYGPSGGASPMQGAAAPAPAGELTLNTRNVANVWGKGGLSVAQNQAPAPTPAPAPPSTSNSSNAFTSGHDRGSSSGAFSGSNPYASASPPKPPQELPKTKEQLEKERRAAALFGGIVPGTEAPAPPPVAPAAPPPRAAPPAPAPAPPPEVDLLDMSMWDSPAPAPPSSVPTTDFDVLSPTPLPSGSASTGSAPDAASATQPQVETVSDEESEPPPVPAPAPPAPKEVDPFAAEGLLGAVQDAPLASLAVSQGFEFNGTTMAPLEITTPQFGQKWGECQAVSNIEVQSSKVTSLNDFMDVCSNAGAYKVETITSTNEGICAGMIGGTQVVLIHGKVHPGSGSCKVTVTVKSTDQAMSGPFAMFLQTMLR